MLLDLDVETVLSPEEMLEESKTKSTFRIIGDAVNNLKNKLNCSVAKRDFNKNLKEIGEIFDRLNPPPAMFEGKEESEIPEVSVYSNTVKVTPNVTIVKNKIVPYGKKADFENEKMVTMPEKVEEEESKKNNEKGNEKGNKKGNKKAMENNIKCDFPGCKSTSLYNKISIVKHKQKNHRINPPSAPPSTKPTKGGKKNKTVKKKLMKRNKTLKTSQH